MCTVCVQKPAEWTLHFKETGQVTEKEMLHTHRSCHFVFPVLRYGKLSRERPVRALSQKACLGSKCVCLFEVFRGP